MNAHARPATVPDLHEVALEADLIGSVLATNRLFWQVADIVSPDDFFDPMHRAVWAAIARQMERDAPAALSMIVAALRPFIEKTRAVEDFDVADYLRNAMDGAPAVPDVRSYAQEIANLARRRRIVDVASRMIDEAYFEREVAPDAIADKAGEAIYEAAHHNEPGRGPEPLIDVIRRAADAAEQARKNPLQARVTTGLQSIDGKLGGFFPRDLHVIGAASSMGKSGIVAQMALGASRAGYVVAVFSIEMASEELATRYLAIDANVPANRIAEGRTSQQDTTRIAEATENYTEGKFFLDGSSNISVAQIRARCQAIRRRNGALHLVVVDHLRLIRPTDPRAPEHERLDQITRDMKSVAKDLECAAVLIAPVNRELWKRDSHRPIVSDLYGASAIEYNADHIWFLHREQFYLERNQPDVTNAKLHGEWQEKLERVRDKAELFGAKRRGGPLGSVMLCFDAPLVRFTEPEDAQQSAQEGFL